MAVGHTEITSKLTLVNKQTIVQTFDPQAKTSLLGCSILDQNKFDIPAIDCDKGKDVQKVYKIKKKKRLCLSPLGGLMPRPHFAPTSSANQLFGHLTLR